VHLDLEWLNRVACRDVTTLKILLAPAIPNCQRRKKVQNETISNPAAALAALPPTSANFPHSCSSSLTIPKPMSSSSSQSQGSSSSPQNTTDYIRSATFSHPDGPSGDNAVTASDLLLMGAYDPTRLHPLADLGDKLDYLLLDDDKTNELPGAGTAIPSRGWSDDLCYGTGTMYLSGR
jgi:hypothetical protein